ncbi:hypothetical protein DMENIID0001_152220 [Sergentomyia squamirostris]
MSAERTKYDSDEKSQEEKFEDAVENIRGEEGSGTSETSTDSDDTEKLTKDFEIVLQLSGSEESRDSPSSSSSWSKCENEESQDGQPETPAETLSQASSQASSQAAVLPESVEPVAHCSRNILPIPVAPEPSVALSNELPIPGPSSGMDFVPRKRPPTVKTSAEWKEIVEKYKRDRQMNEKLREICKNIEKLRTKTENESSNPDLAATDDDSSSEDSDSDDDMSEEEISELIQKMMDRPIKGKTVEKLESNMLYRALSVSLFLKTLGGKYSKEIITKILDMLDGPTKALWLDELIAGEVPTFDEFVKFLYFRCAIQDDLDYVRMGTERQTKCYCCKLTHKMFGCAFFRSRGVGIRWKMTKDNYLCSNCLHGRHTVAQCNSINNCKICDKRHNTILHPRKFKKAKQEAQKTQ